MTWSLGGTIDSNSRLLFDKFFREILSGMIDAHPRPKSVKISKQNNFPERGTVFDFCFLKQGNGLWENWASLIENVEFPARLSEIAKLEINSNSKFEFQMVC